MKDFSSANCRSIRTDRSSDEQCRCRPVRIRLGRACPRLGMDHTCQSDEPRIFYEAGDPNYA